MLLLWCMLSLVRFTALYLLVSVIINLLPQITVFKTITTQYSGQKLHKMLTHIVILKTVYDRQKYFLI